MNISETIWDFIMKHDKEVLKEVFPEWMESNKSIGYHYTQREAAERIHKYEQDILKEKKKDINNLEESCNGCPFLPYCEEHAWNSVDEVVKDVNFNLFLLDFCEKSFDCDHCPFDEVCSENEVAIAVWPDSNLKALFQKYRKCKDQKKQIEERKDLFFHLGIVTELSTGRRFYVVLNIESSSCFTIWTIGKYDGCYYTVELQKTEYSFEDTGLVLDKDILRTSFLGE